MSFNLAARDMPCPYKLRADLFSDAFFLRPQLGCEFCAKVFGFEDLPNFDFTTLKRRFLQPFDRFVFRVTFPEPEARDKFLSFSKRSVDNPRLALAFESNARSLRARLQAFARQHHACVREFFVVLAHVSQQLLARHDARFRIFVRFHNNHESHFVFSLSCFYLSLVSRTTAHRIDNSREKVSRLHRFFRLPECERGASWILNDAEPT